jgi:hypothetical protein
MTMTEFTNPTGSKSRGVHKLGRALEWRDLQRDRVCAPHEAILRRGADRALRAADPRHLRRARGILKLTRSGAAGGLSWRSPAHARCRYSRSRSSLRPSLSLSRPSPIPSPHWASTSSTATFSVRVKVTLVLAFADTAIVSSAG